jgi:sodium transport system permease protein
VNAATIKTLFRTELRMVLRDRRMLFTSIVLPLLVTPLMFLGSSWGIKRQEKKLEQMVYAFTIAGKQTNEVSAIVAATRARLEAEAVTNQAAFRLRETPCPDPAAALDKGDIQFVLEGVAAGDTNSSGKAAPKSESAGRKAAPRKDAEDELEEGAGHGAPIIRITFRADRHESMAGHSKIRQALEETRRRQRAELLKQRGFPLRAAEVAAITERDLASKAQTAGLALGRSLTVLLLLFILSSGAVVATDSLAGEKERGTLETLLTTAAGRLEILAAKHLVIVAVALIITSIQILNLLVYIHFKLIPVPENLAAALTPATALLLFVLYLPLAALAATVLLLVSGYARTYKEAQMWFMPVMLVGLLPALAPLLPGVPLRSAAVLVPVANLALAAKEILVGSFDWPMIVLSWLITAGAALWTGRMGARTLVQEKLITASETDEVDLSGGPRLFERRVLRWFAVLWAVLLLVSNYTQKLDLRLQLVINLVGLFFGACCLMMWVYRLSPRVALAWRAPRAPVWAGVLLGIPGGFLTALGCFRLANLLIPAPAQMTESFAEMLFPEQIPFAQLVLIMSLLPGVFEEMTFRGLLLHGLRRRLSPVPLALVVGVVFGIFHVALFRLVPTACLGVMFAAVTLLTGSIFPAMLWHAANNALGLMVYQWQFPENELDATCYLAGVGLLTIAFWIFWRFRTPYPDLRPSRRNQSRSGSE